MRLMRMRVRQGRWLLTVGVSKASDGVWPQWRLVNDQSVFSSFVFGVFGVKYQEKTCKVASI